MKKIFIGILSLVALSCSKSDDNSVPVEPETLDINLPDIPCGDWNIQVSTIQKIRFVKENSELFTDIDPQFLSIWCTYENGEMEYAPNGVPLKDYEHLATIEPIYNSSNEIEYYRTVLGRSTNVNYSNYQIGYFKIQLNANRIDTIRAIYDIRCENYILYMIRYNNKDYYANEFGTIDIIVK